MTYQTNHLKLPILSFLGALCGMKKRNEPNTVQRVKKQNEPNVGHVSLPKGEASLLDFKYYKTKPNTAFSIEKKLCPKKQSQFLPVRNLALQSQRVLLAAEKQAVPAKTNQLLTYL
jgi:hypothetical protein